MAWAFAAAAVVVITSFTSSYTYVNAEQQHTTINCSTKSSNKKSSEQTTTDGLIFAFFDFRPRNFLLANNIPKANKILHTPNEGVEIAKWDCFNQETKAKIRRERENLVLTWNWIRDWNILIENCSSSAMDLFNKSFPQNQIHWIQISTQLFFLLYSLCFCLWFQKFPFSHWSVGSLMFSNSHFIWYARIFPLFIGLVSFGQFNRW